MEGPDPPHDRGGVGVVVGWWGGGVGGVGGGGGGWGED